MNAEKRRRILWAVDAFEEDPGFNKRFFEVLEPLAAKLKADIEPVYVLSPEQLNLPTEFSLEGLESYSEMAKRELHYLTEKSSAPLLEPMVIQENTYSLTRTAKALSRYALESLADFIVTASHGRHGVERAMLGSFTETLLAHSPVPVLVVGGRFNHQINLNEILFATDFSLASERAYGRVLEFARALNAHITLFHFVAHPIEPIVETGINSLGGTWASFHEYVREIETGQKRELELWVGRGRDNGVDVTCATSTGDISVDDAILTYARSNKTGIIAMAAESGAVASALLGSVSRKVLRTSPLPVLIIRQT